MGWKLKRDGWHKEADNAGNLVIGGVRASYFQKDPPPVRNSANMPMKNADEIDFGKLIQEVNEGKWQKN